MSAPPSLRLKLFALFASISVLALAGCSENTSSPTYYSPAPSVKATGPQVPEPRTMPVNGVWSYSTSTSYFDSNNPNLDTDHIVLPTLETHTAYAMRVTAWRAGYRESPEWRLKIWVHSVLFNEFFLFGREDGKGATSIWLPLVSPVEPGESPFASDELPYLGCLGSNANMRMEIVRIDQASDLPYWDGEKEFKGKGIQLIRTSHAIAPEQIVFEPRGEPQGWCRAWVESSESGELYPLGELYNDDIPPMVADAIFVACADSRDDDFDVYSEVPWTLRQATQGAKNG